MRRIFIDVAQIDLKEHLPSIVDFWQQIVFGTAEYHKNVMQLHLGLNEKTKLSPDHFQTWLKTFETAVDAHFCGENSEKIKTRALSIATVMRVKLSQIAY
jgi:hemoglobin